MLLIRKVTITFFTLFFVLAPSLSIFSADKTDKHPPVKSSKEFQKLKALEGSWEGVDPDKTNEKVRVKYHATSAGTALVERLFPGTPNEMISVYYDKNGKVAMTHYCALGNQPELELIKAKGKNYEFILSPRSNIDADKETHMHALTITLTDSNHMTQKWVSYENGKEKETHLFQYTRVNK